MLLFCATLFAQNIIVVDKASGLPIKGVSVSNKNKSIVLYTDYYGKVDLSIFKKSKQLFFYHASYLKEKKTYDSFSAKDKFLKLEKITQTLDEVFLSVSKNSEKNSRIAEQTFVQNLREIRKISPQTSADLLQNTPGIKVQKSQFGGGSPVLRGMETNRVLLVVDGVRMNNAIYRKGHLQNSLTVSPSILDRVEVIYGPSSVIYGSDALGGVIHYYTKPLKTTEKEEVKTSVFSRLSSVNNEITTHFDAELSFKKWASYTNIAYSNFGDLKMGKNREHGFTEWGKVDQYSENTETNFSETSSVNSNSNLQKNTGYSQKDFLQKFYFPISNEVELLVNMQYSESSNIPRFDALTEMEDSGDLKFAEWYYGPQKRFLISTQLKLDEINKWVEKGTITLAYQDVEESRIQRKFGSLEKSFRYENVGVYSLNGDFSVSLNKEKNKNLAYGFEVVYNDVNSMAYGNVLKLNDSETSVIGVDGNFAVQTRYPDAGSSYFTQALYTGYRQDINEKNTLSTGLRYTATRLTAQWVEDPETIVLPSSKVTLQNNAVTANIGHAYMPNKNLKLSAVLSSGFRSPNVDDIGKIREKNNSVTLPNILLKPEYAYNSEVGVLHYFNDRLFQVGVNVYYTLLNNYIIRAAFDKDTQTEGASTMEYEGETVAVFANVNRGNAFITGGTFHFKGELNQNWFTKGDLTYTKGKTYDTDEPLSSIPPLFGSFSVGYKMKKIESVLRYDFNSAKKVSDYNLSEGIDNIDQTPIINPTSTEDSIKYAGTPSWQTLHYSFLYDINSKVDLQLQIQNIFDVHYKEFASGVSAPGRNFSVSLKYQL